jgi:hypothetical protein
MRTLVSFVFLYHRKRPNKYFSPWSLVPGPLPEHSERTPRLPWFARLVPSSKMRRNNMDGRPVALGGLLETVAISVCVRLSDFG